MLGNSVEHWMHLGPLDAIPSEATLTISAAGNMFDLRLTANAL